MPVKQQCSPMERHSDEQVRELLSKFSDRPTASITAAQSLQDDLGIDGDDAVELFADFAERFEVDLSSLHSHWPEHFGPEGIPLRIGLLWMLVMAPPMLLGRWVGLPQWAALMIGVAVWIVWIGPLRSWPLKSDIHLLTVATLFEAAATKCWPVHYGDAPT
jgi:acyl carrier protein